MSDTPGCDDLDWEASREDDSGFSHIRIVDRRLQERAEAGDEMAQILIEIRRAMPSVEDREFLRTERIARERATWAWQMTRKHVPWISGLISSIGLGAYWVVTHFQFRAPQ